MDILVQEVVGAQRLRLLAAVMPGSVHLLDRLGCVCDFVSTRR